MTGTPLLVRRLQPVDWEVLREARLAALADAPLAFASTLAREETLTEDDWRRRIGHGCSVAATASGTTAGIAGGYLHDGVPELISMWVAPAFRGRGVAASLVDAVAEWAVDQGGERLTLWVVVGNEVAERTYRRLGFEPTGAVQPVPGNPNLDEVQMARPIP